MPGAIGAGASSFGVGAFGVGTPAITTAPAGNTLTGPGGLQYGSRLIGYDIDNRGQYVIDDNGMAEGQSNARQLVYMAIETALNSSAVKGLGRDAVPSKIDANFLQEMSTMMQNALQDLIDRQIVRFDGVQLLQNYDGRTFTRVEIFDLTTLQPIKLNL